MRKISCLLVACALISGCDDADGDVTAQDTPVNEVVPTQNADDTSPSSYIENDGYMLNNSHANILRNYIMTQPDDDGLVPGFNLDEEITAEGDERSCGQGDFVDQQGRTGIDNQFADLWKTVEPLIGEATEALIKGAVNEGRIALVVELEDVDDLQNDDDVTLHLYRGIIQPDIGNLGVIAPDQTVYFDPEFSHSTVRNVHITDGVIEADPPFIDLPVDILDAFFVMRLDNARIRMEIQDDGTFQGIFGGIVDLEAVFEELLQTNASQEAALVRPIFFNYADMNNGPDGCTHASAAFGFEGTTAFAVRYPEPPEPSATEND